MSSLRLRRFVSPSLVGIALLGCVVACNASGGSRSSGRRNDDNEEARTKQAVASERSGNVSAKQEERATITSVATARASHDTAASNNQALPQFVGAPMATNALLDALGSAPLRRFKSVGTSSIVFQTKLEAPFDAAFKPKTRMRAFGYQAEVAAFRLAGLLGMDNVPPAAVRRVLREDLRVKLNADDADAWSEIAEWTLWDETGKVTGAMIYWVPNMRPVPVAREQWEPWLRQDGTVPAEQRSLARDISSLLAFDYLIANWDRFSGGNLHASAAGDRLIVRDHDVAFATPLPARLHTRILEHLRRSERFSRELIERIDALTEDRFREAVVDESSTGGSLLSDAQIRDTVDRRAALLSYVRSLVEAHGESNVLAFP